LSSVKIYRGSVTHSMHKVEFVTALDRDDIEAHVEDTKLSPEHFIIEERL